MSDQSLQYLHTIDQNGKPSVELSVREVDNPLLVQPMERPNMKIKKMEYYPDGQLKSIEYYPVEFESNWEDSRTIQSEQ